nr:MAG TPA: hypothetical protein [Caudoviricetes sp.]
MRVKKLSNPPDVYMLRVHVHATRERSLKNDLF